MQLPTHGTAIDEILVAVSLPHAVCPVLPSVVSDVPSQALQGSPGFALYVSGGHNLQVPPTFSWPAGQSENRRTWCLQLGVVSLTKQKCQDIKKLKCLVVLCGTLLYPQLGVQPVEKSAMVETAAMFLTG